MMFQRLITSNLISKGGACIRNAVAFQSYAEHFLQTPVFVRWNTTEAVQLKENQPPAELKDLEGLKGHDVFTLLGIGWRTTDTHPLVIEKSEGSYVYDINRRKYLDCLAGFWRSTLGGHEPRLVAAATRQLNTLPFYHSFWNRTTRPSLELAMQLLENFTANKMGKVFFTNSGSEANDTQIKLVWYYNNALGRPAKKKIIAQMNSHHGSTGAAASLSGLPALHQKIDLSVQFVLHTDCPHYWRFHLPGETEEEFATRLANDLDDLIIIEGPETIGAFIAEPVMCDGGVILPPATYFEKVQAVLKKYDILFIADEAICGFGRLGTMFGCDKYNIKPDLVSIDKALSSGHMPIGAVLVSPEVSDVLHSQSNKLGSFSHGFTYSGHPVSCAVALETLKIYQERNVVENAQKVSTKFQDGIKAFSDSPIVGEIRGTGLIIGTEFVDNKSPNDLFPSEWRIGRFFENECETRGLLVKVAGDSIIMCPSLTISSEEIDELICIYGEALKATEKRVAELQFQQEHKMALNRLASQISAFMLKH